MSPPHEPKVNICGLYTFRCPRDWSTVNTPLPCHFMRKKKEAVSQCLVCYASSRRHVLVPWFQRLQKKLKGW